MKSKLGDKQFRPYFNAAELSLTLNALRNVVHTFPEIQGIIDKLEVFEFKISKELVNPSNIIVGNAKDRMRAAITNDIPDAMDYKKIAETLTNKAVKRKFMYDRTLTHPEWQPSPEELNMINTYRWENGLMELEERMKFETEMFKL